MMIITLQPLMKINNKKITFRYYQLSKEKYKASSNKFVK